MQLAGCRVLGHVVTVGEHGVGVVASEVVSCGDWAGPLRYSFRAAPELKIGDSIWFTPSGYFDGRAWATAVTHADACGLGSSQDLSNDMPCYPTTSLPEQPQAR
eukprot:508568-Amphidinium_carterae.1